MQNYGEQIAKASLEIKSIKLSPDDPFTWASGYRMPIYNDNRMLLGDYNHRMLVTNAFKDLIEAENISFDYIAGTSTAGIAPATSVANHYKVPLLIIQDGVPYVFEQPFEVDSRKNASIVASTCPWAIPFGVTLANERQVPFVYVRQKKKAHGLKQQIEGITNRGQTAVLINYHRGDDYADKAVEALGEQGVIVKELISENISDIVRPSDINGKKVPYIEDLISTGESSAKEVKAARDHGAICNNCLSIFSYELDKAAEAFGSLDPECKAESSLTYNMLLDFAKKTGYLNNEQVEVLQNWRADPFNWGEKHGFPMDEKK